MPVINLLNLWMAFESLLWVGAATMQKNIFRIHNYTCIATGYRMSPINNSTTTICTSFTCFARRAGVFTVAATMQKNIFRIHNYTCIATGYRMSPINNSTTTICTSFTCFARRAGVFTVAVNPIILGPRMSPVEIALWCLGSNFQNCCTISTSTYT